MIFGIVCNPLLKYPQENCSIKFINGTFTGFAASSVKQIGKIATLNLHPKFEVLLNVNLVT